MNKNILLIDTASKLSFASIIDNSGKVSCSHKWESGVGSSEKVYDFDISNTEIKGIAVFVGPGSFTGLRVGITYANTLSYAKKIPIIAIDEFEIASVIEKLDSNIVLIDNIHDLIYARFNIEKSFEYFVGNLDQLNQKAIDLGYDLKKQNILGVISDKDKIKKANSVFNKFSNISFSDEERQRVFSKIAIQKIENTKYQFPNIRPLYINKPHITLSKK